MTNEKESKVLTPKELETALKAIEALENLMSIYAVNLSIKERRTLVMAGPLSIPFIERTLMYANEYPQYVPPFFELEKFKKDWELFRQLETLLKQLEPLVDKITDTYKAAGSEAHTAARNFYKLIKTAAQSNTPGTDAIAADLKKLYKKPRKKNKTEENFESKDELEKKEELKPTG